MNGKNIVFDDNGPGPVNPSLITPLERVHNNNQSTENQTYKLLGIYFDENMTFNTHISKLCAKLTRSIYCLSKVKNILPPTALRTLYYLLIHSHQHRKCL